MKIFFAGTPEVAVPALEVLSRAHEVVGVLTRPDAPLGRKRILTPSPVALAAERLRIPVVKASRIDVQIATEIAATEADLGVVVAYGALIPRATLASFPQGWINLHFSELPILRGAAPLQRAIIGGATEVGLTVFKLVAELDAGDVLDVVSEKLAAEETAGDAFTRLSEIGSEQLRRVVDDLEAGHARAVPQYGEPTYAQKLSIADGQLFSTSSRRDAHNRFRGVTPEPGAWIETSTGRVKILACTTVVSSAPETIGEPRKLGTALCVNGVVQLRFADGDFAVTQVQPAGKLPMSATDWFRGIHEPQDWRFE